MDQLLEHARTALDPSERMRLYREAERLILLDAPVIPLVHDVEHILVKPNVSGIELTPMGLLSFRRVGFDGGEPAK